MDYELGDSTLCYEFPINREDQEGLVLLSCKKIPEMFAAVTAESEIRPAIELCLKNALSKGDRRVQVFTNGRLDVPVIGVIVKITQ